LKDSVLEEITALVALQPLLTVISAKEDVLISGKYKICNQIDDEVFEDYFALEIHIPNNFPGDIPKVKTIDGRIRADNYKGHIYSNGEFCLETNTAMAAYLQNTPSLLGFLTKYLDTYLCGFLYYRKHKQLPFGEHRHGGFGLLDYYCELFETSDIKIAFMLLDCLVNRNLKGHIQCPCQSGLRYRNCHRERINELKESGLFERYKTDLITIVAEVYHNVKNES
jgi:hypothetical protein